MIANKVQIRSEIAKKLQMSSDVNRLLLKHARPSSRIYQFLPNRINLLRAGQFTGPSSALLCVAWHDPVSCACSEIVCPSHHLLPRRSEDRRFVLVTKLQQRQCCASVAD